MDKKIISFNDFAKSLNYKKLKTNLERQDYDLKLDSTTFKDNFMCSDSYIKTKIFNIIDIIVENTQIIKFSEFITNLFEIFNKCIIMINDKIKTDIKQKFYIYYSDYNSIMYPYGKILSDKSNYWVSVLFNYYVLSNNKLDDEILNNIFYINDTYYIQQLKDNTSNILFFDDCIYSGVQMATNIYNLSIPKTYNFLNFFNNKKKLSIPNIYIYVPYISKYGYNNIVKNTFDNIKIIYKNYITNLSDDDCKLYNKIMLSDVDIIDNDKNIKSLVKHYFNITKRHSLIIFEHKIADNISIPYLLYTKLPSNINNIIGTYEEKDITGNHSKKEIKLENNKIEYMSLLQNCPENNDCFITDYKKKDYYDKYLKYKNKYLQLKYS